MAALAMTTRPGVSRDAVGLGLGAGLALWVDPAVARAHDGALIVLYLTAPAALLTALGQVVLLTRRSWRPRWAAASVGALLVGLPVALWAVLSLKPWPGEWLLWATTMAYGAGLSAPLSWVLTRQGRAGAAWANTAGCAVAVPALVVAGAWLMMR